MTVTYSDALKIIAQTPKGKERALLLKDDDFRAAVLSSGANVTIYSGRPHNAETAKEALSDVYIGLLQRKNKQGKLDGLGALGGMAERTREEEFYMLDELKRLDLIGQKDDVILDGMHPILTSDINIIRKNNVLRELREELNDLGITDITIQPDKLELIDMPKVKDDNFMINIWNGQGECFAITPYCHIYEDKTGLIDEISFRAKEKSGGEAVTYKKIALFDALMAYGNLASDGNSLEDGRSADRDYRYPHEYLTAWALAAKLLHHQPERMIALAQEVQSNSSHQISFMRIAKATGQTMDDIADVLKISHRTLAQMEKAMNDKCCAIKQKKFNSEYLLLLLYFWVLL